MQQYVQKLQRLSERLTCALAEALDMAPDHFNRFFEPDPHIRMKVVQYPPRTSVPDPEGFGVGPHKGERAEEQMDRVSCRIRPSQRG